MEKRLVLQDKQGNVVRAFSWQGEPVKVVRRSDTRRLELVTDVAELQKRRIDFEDLGDLTSPESLTKPLLIGELGHLAFVESVHSTEKDLPPPKDRQRDFYQSLLILGLLCVGFLGYLQSVPHVTPGLEEELKQQVVKIVKTLKVEPPKVDVAQTMNSQERASQTQPKPKAVNVKRMGALSVLGSLKTGKQRGGLDLGAAQTTAGPGLGGTQGSGGVQTSLYAKGLVAAPLGPGGNVKGAGGYGTKGAGGGQAGYGKLSLVGSVGTAPIPLGSEATVASGLDRDLIAAVIQQHLGQVRFCYEQGLQSDPSLAGRVAVNFTIGGNGLVKAAGVESSSMGSKLVEDCIVMRLRSWKFPLPEGGVDVKVTYPFLLRRSGQG